MRFTQDSSSAINAIRAYGAGELRINDAVYREALIVTGATVESDLAIRGLEDLAAEHAARILALQPELVLLGTGPTQIFPPPGFGALFLRAGVGFEVMDTGAACRTFNVLAGEGRRVVALLLA